MTRRSVLWIAGPLLILLLWAVIYPNIAVVMGSFGHGLEYWRAFASSPSDREALWTSLWISVASVIASVGVGLPLAFLLTRMEFRGRRVLLAAATVPAALPPLVDVIATPFSCTGRAASSRASCNSCYAARRPHGRCRGRGRSCSSTRTRCTCTSTCSCPRGSSGTTARSMQAASGLGAGAFRRLYRVTLPMLTPALAGACLLVFMSSLGSFSAPYVFGGGLRVLATQIVTSRLNGAMSRVRGDDGARRERGGGPWRC